MASISPPSHTRSSVTTDSWITPKWLVDRLAKHGGFDLDPCACDPQPWPCAARSYTEKQDGLLQDWAGEVYMNPPYGKRAAAWLRRLADHGNGVALIFARTDTKMFFSQVWGRANAVLFIRGRLTFFRPDGSPPRLGANSGGPSCLIAYGAKSSRRLLALADLGAIVKAPFIAETK